MKFYTSCYISLLLGVSALCFNDTPSAVAQQRIEQPADRSKSRTPQTRSHALRNWTEVASLRPDLLVVPNPYLVPAHPRKDDPENRPAGADDTRRLSEAGGSVHGIYITTAHLMRQGADRIIHQMRQAGANAAILDVKDDRGRIVYPSSIVSTPPWQAAFIKDMKAIVKRFQDAGIYTIARVVCFKDDAASGRHPSWSIRDRTTEEAWRDHGATRWLDPYNRDAQDYLISIVQEVSTLGFDEIQLDYIRFPVDDSVSNARFPAWVRKPRHLVIADFVKAVRDAVSLPLSVDVFGLTTYTTGDPNNLGQSLEHLAPHIDAISPMLYVANFPRRYWQNYSHQTTYDLIYTAVSHTRRRMGPGVAVRPLLQAFSWRASDYGVPFIANQIAAARAAESSGFLLWNQLANYETAFDVLRGMGQGNLLLMASERWKAGR